MPSRSSSAIAALSLAALSLAGPPACSDGTSSAEAVAAAKQRVREQAGLSESAALFGGTFVATTDEGLLLCGTVEGRRADGGAVAPRRFIAATDPLQWVRFETPGDANYSPYQFAQDWAHHCAGEKEAR